MDLPSYIVYRPTEPGQPFDPTSQLAFFPPKDSDELFDALRAKYPHIGSHQERIREAVIEYLLQEDQLNCLPTTELPGAQMTSFSSSMTSQCPALFPSAASNSVASSWSSPAISFDASTWDDPPQSQPPSRQLSNAGTVPRESIPPAIEQMTGCFSLSDANQPKQRVRRKMTEQEKVEYRKRRIVKACDKCSKRKRKCNHNQQEMESVASKSHKTSLASWARTSKTTETSAPGIHKIPEPDETLMADDLEFGSPFGWRHMMQPSDDFANLLEPPLSDLDLAALLSSSSAPQWPWTPTPDFTLMDCSGDGFATRPSSGLQYGDGLLSRCTMLSPILLPTFDNDMSYNFSGKDNNMTTTLELPSNDQLADPLPMYNTPISDTGGEQPPDRSTRDDSVTCNLAEVAEARQRNMRVEGDGRRTTHSQTAQERSTSSTSTTGKKHELDALVHSSSTAQEICRASMRDSHSQNQQEPTRTPTVSTQTQLRNELDGSSIMNTSPRMELFKLRRRNAERSSANHNERRIASSDTFSATRQQTLTTTIQHSHTQDVREIALASTTSCGAQITSHRDSEMHQEVLSDHQRHRDHFGRDLPTTLQAFGILVVVSSLIGLFLLLGLSNVRTSALSMAPLALMMVSPISDVGVSSRRLRCPVSGKASRGHLDMKGLIYSSLGFASPGPMAEALS